MVHEMKRSLPILVISFVIIFSGFSQAGKTAKSKSVEDHRISQHGSNFQPHMGTFYYLFELNGINVGTGWISISQEGSLYKIRFGARTNKKMDRIYKARYNGEGIMETDTLTPVVAKLHQRVKSKEKNTAIYFEDNRRITAVETKSEKGEEPEHEVREIREMGSIFDPISVIYLIQGIDWEIGKEKVFDIYTGKARYETKFTCVDEEVIDVAGEKRNAWVITQESRNLDKNQETDPEKEKPGLRIYVSADGFRDMLKVETTRRIGHVTLTLQRFEPASGHSPDQGIRQ